MKQQRHVSIRMDADMLDKFYYDSKYNGKSGSGQILFLMRLFVSEFEKQHGAISKDVIKSEKS